jgi:hypothetical protein
VLSVCVSLCHLFCACDTSFPGYMHLEFLVLGPRVRAPVDHCSTHCLWFDPLTVGMPCGVQQMEAAAHLGASPHFISFSFSCVRLCTAWHVFFGCECRKIRYRYRIVQLSIDDGSSNLPLFCQVFLACSGSWAELSEMPGLVVRLIY